MHNVLIPASKLQSSPHNQVTYLSIAGLIKFGDYFGYFSRENMWEPSHSFGSRRAEHCQLFSPLLEAITSRWPFLSFLVTRVHKSPIS